MPIAFGPENPADTQNEETEWIARYASFVTRNFVKGALRYNDSNMLRELGAVALAPVVFFKTLLVDGPKAYRAYKAAQSEIESQRGYIQL